MKKSQKLLFSLMALGLSLPTSLLAAEFNPNFIISDEEMQAWETMDRSDIQAFLEDKDSYLSNYKTDDWEGTQRLASDIIFQASKDNKINPKYLLVKLQKEQSLISNDSPTEKQLDWATGYGVCDSCKTTDPDIQKYKGFGTQVDRAAGIMRWYYDNITKESWIKRAGVTYTIDDEQIIPQSNATGFLYSYTPHIHGNENFWKLWQAWFQQVYPDSTIIQAKGDSAIYLIQDGKKRKFKNMTSLVTRYNPDMIISVSSSELTRYPDGPEISLPNYAIVKNGSSYYLLDYDYKRPFASYDVVKNLGYNPDEIIEVTTDDLSGYVAGPMIGTAKESPLGRVVQVKENGSLYYILDGHYHSIYDESVAKLNYAHLSIEKVSATELYDLKKGNPILPKNGTIFGITGNPKIYVVENNKKRHIATASVFEDFGYNWNNIIWVSQATGDKIETGQSLYEKPHENIDAQKDIIIADNSPDTIKIVYTTIREEENLTPSEYLVKTPTDKVQYIGPKFNTDVDTYLVADYETGNILAGKNIDSVRPLASLTKVVTAYQLFQDNINLDDIISYNPDIHKARYHRFRIQDGEKIRAKDLMYSMLVSSKNTASRMLVNRKEEQDTAFVTRMEKTAHDLGLTHMSFADTSGFDTGNQSTAREYIQLFKKVTENKIIQNYLGTKEYTYSEVYDTDGFTEHFGNHSNKLMNEEHAKYTILASKTGFLYDAGANLVMLVERQYDHKKFMIITMGNPEFDTDKQFDMPDTFTTWAMNTL